MADPVALSVREWGDSNPPDFEAQAYHEWRMPDGTVWTSFHRTAHGYVLCFPGIAQFLVDSRGSRVDAWPAPGTSPHTLEHLYLNQVLPLALSQQGRVVLHASCVALGTDCIAFAGASGAGKSTLAASFALDGGPFLCDDGLVLDLSPGAWVAQPAHASVRLWQDSRDALLAFAPAPQLAPPLDFTSKGRVLAGNAIPHCEHALPLAHVFFLGGEAAEVNIEPVRPAQALLELVKNSFLLDTRDPLLIGAQFDVLSHMVQRPCTFWSLQYPRDWSQLPAVRHAIRRHVERQGPA